MPRTNVTIQLRRAVEEAHGRRCWLCLRRIEVTETISPDHVVPVRHGGTDDIDNLRPAHYRCNTMRSDWDVTSYYAWAMSGRPEWVDLVPLSYRGQVASDAGRLHQAAASYYPLLAGPLEPLTGSWTYTQADEVVTE